MSLDVDYDLIVELKANLDNIEELLEDSPVDDDNLVGSVERHE